MSKKEVKTPTGKRANNAGTLIKTSTGLFLAKWCFQGKTMVKSTKTYDREKALEKLDEFVRPYLESNEIAVLENLQAKIRTINAIQQQEEQKKNRVLITDLFDKYLEHPDVSGLATRTQENYRAMINTFVKWIEENHKEIVMADQVTKTIAEEFLSYLGKKVGTIRYNYVLNLLGMVFRVLKQGNVWAGFKRKALEYQHPRRALTKEELKKLLDYLDGESKDLRLIFTLAIYTGLRIGDCCMLKWGEVDMEKGMIVKLPHKTKKTGRYVTIPIHDRVRKCLEEFERRDADEFVSEENAYRMRTDYIRAFISKIMLDCGLKKRGDYYGAHILRHTFCTLMANNGVPMPILQNMLGHSRPDMTMRYYHFDTDVAVSAIKNIGV